MFFKLNFSDVPNNNCDIKYYLNFRIYYYDLVDSIGEAVIEIPTKIISCNYTLKSYRSLHTSL